MVHFLGPCLASWATKKQHSVAMSTAEAEYIAAASLLCTTVVDKATTQRFWY